VSFVVSLFHHKDHKGVICGIKLSGESLTLNHATILSFLAIEENPQMTQIFAEICFVYSSKIRVYLRHLRKN